MLKAALTHSHAARNRRQLQRFWSDAALNTPSLGCGRCPERAVCGGLQVRGAAFDCISQTCCNDPDNCDAVCRRNPVGFAERVREVSGFGLENVPRANVLVVEDLPAVAPVLYHGKRRERPFRGSPAVCLPLYSVIERANGTTRYADRLALAAGFHIGVDVPIILTGTSTDRPLERWWSLGNAGRLAAIRALRGLGVVLVSTPNFSLFPDQPRWDDLHSMKRIAIVHEEFLREGLPAALHVNARTDRDWERWRDYVAARPEVTHVAFEFATGAGWANRIDWHATHLVGLAASVSRPVQLVLRGGSTVLSSLADAFERVTVLDTSVSIKTSKRQRASLMKDGTVSWQPSPTKVDAPLDDLLIDNWAVVAASYRALCTRHVPRMAATG